MDLVLNLVSLIVGMGGFYFTSYTKMKGRNKALQEDIVKLEEEKQKIVAKHAKEIEEVKKQHTLDIEKRKYQYESKRNEFAKFFKLMDEFTNKSNTKFQEDFLPIINDFMLSAIDDDFDCKNEAFSKFNDAVQKITFEFHEEHLKLTTETKSIRLITSPTMDQLLDAVEESVKLCKDASSEMVKVMATIEYLVDQSILKPYELKVYKLGQQVKEGYEKLKAQMKIELDEI